MYKLRELESKDLVFINRWRNDEKLIELLGAPYRYINLDVDMKWFENYMSNRENTIRCAIIRENEDAILGLISLVSINYINQSAEMHIMIGDEENHGKGIGTFAITAILKHAFYNMNLQRVELETLENNTIAKHVYKKVGFIQEGIRRKSRYKKGKFMNTAIYSILREEFSYNQERR